MTLEQRLTWHKHLDFLLSTIGFAVDLANVWRFPYYVYALGGGAFLIPYFLILLLVAIPSFYMELLLGQSQQESMISVWKICPIFKGVGYCQLIVNMTVMCYYNVIIGWSLYFFFATIVGGLPWMSCSGKLFTSFCLPSDKMLAWREKKENFTKANLTWPPPGEIETAQLPSNEYFERTVLGLHEGRALMDIGYPRWQLAVCTFLVFILLFFCLRKGVRSSGKVVYLTATLPYILLTAMLVQGCLLKGSLDGIKVFIIPNFSRLLDPQVWFFAASQIFFSVGSGFGVHITFASYQKPNDKALRDCLITSAANSLTSLLAGFVVFAYLGYMSFITGIPVDKVANEGPGLVFQVYPIAVGSLPGAPAWSLLFFFLIILLGLDSSMGGIESLVTGVRDEMRNLCKNCVFLRHVYLLIIFIIIGFLGSLLIVTNSGVFLMTLLDYSVGIPLVFTAFLQLVGVSWFYGMGNFCDDIKKSCGYTPSMFWRIFWKVISPLLIIVLLVMSFINLPPMSFQFGAYHPELAKSLGITPKELVYELPSWSSNVVWALRGFQLLPILLGIIIAPIVYRSFYKAISPVWEHEFWSNTLQRKKVAHWISFGQLTTNRRRTYSMTGFDNPIPVSVESSKM